MSCTWPRDSVLDVTSLDVFLETFTVSTWRERLRQHVEPGTVADAAHEERARAYLAGNAGAVVGHLVWAYAVPAARADTEPDVVPTALPEPAPTAAPAAADPP